jgi:hypothetical protein
VIESSLFLTREKCMAPKITANVNSTIFGMVVVLEKVEESGAVYSGQKSK